MRGIVLGIGVVGAAVKDVIGGEVDQAGVHLAAGQRQVAHGQAIHQVGGLRLLFGDIHMVIGGGVEYHVGVGAGERSLDGGAIGDIDLCALPAGDGIAADSEFADKF